MAKALKRPAFKSEDKDFTRAMEIKRYSQPNVDRFVRSARVVTDMHAECYDTSDDPNTMTNPMIIAQTIDRMVEQLRPLDYILRIPNSTKEERQVARDGISQILDESGFVSCLRDDQRGFLSLASTGNTIIMVGSSDEKETPIKFRCLSISQCYFPTSATQLRSKSGENDANECLIVFEFPLDEVLERFPQAKGNIEYGDLPEQDGEGKWQNAKDNQDRDREKITQVGMYFNKIKKIHKTFIGRTAWKAEEFKGEKYRWILDGRAYLPVIWLRAKKLVGELYGVAIGQQNVKLAREDQRRRNMAFRHVENNVYPTRGVRMEEDRFGEFMATVDEAALIRAEGGDPIVRLEPNDPGGIETFGSNPLTQEFERMNADTTEQIKRNGTAIQDVDRPATQTATQTISEERAKTRAAVQIGENNATEYQFVYRLIIDFTRRFTKVTNDTPVATNVKVTLGAAEGIPPEQGQIEAPVGEITLGQVASYFKAHKKIVVQEDSRSGAWETDAFLLAKTTQKLQFGAGTPAEAKLRQEALGNLGEDILAQDLVPIPEQQGQSPTPSPADVAVQAGGLPVPPQIKL